MSPGSAASVVSETRDLKLMVALDEEGSLQAAARRLHLTPSALSQQLRELERKLGGALFLRQWRRLVMTTAGQRFLQGARGALRELERVEAETRQLLAGSLGQIRLAAGCQQSFRWLPELLRRYAEAEPAVEVTLIAEAAQAPFDWLVERRLDVALVADRIPRDRRLRVTRLFRDELVAVVPRRAHPWSRRPQVSAKDFADAHLFTDAGALERTAPLGRALALASVAPRRTTMVPMVGTVAVDLVRAGLGVTLLPRWTVAPLLRANGLRTVRVGARGLWLDWALVTRNEPLERPLGAFVETVRRHHPQARQKAS